MESRRGATLLAFSLVTLILLQSGLTAKPIELEDVAGPMGADAAPDDNLYKLYLTEPGGNASAGMDGLISTRVPENDDSQESASALDADVEFRTIELHSSMEFYGRKYHANDSYYIPVNLFLKATGSQNANVDWTVTIGSTSDGTVGSTTWDGGAVCSSSFGSTCEFDYESLEVGIGNQDSFEVRGGERLVLEVRATISGCDDGLFSDCSAEVAWGNIDGENRFSNIESDANALMDSIIVVQRKGANIAEGPEVDWYPNDIMEDREMQFSLDAKSAFGRDDISKVEILMRDPDGNYRIDYLITGDEEDIEDSSYGVFGEYLWTYPSGLTSGEYSVTLRITDIQGNRVDVEHEAITMHEWGVSLKHRYDRTIEYFAPGQITPIPLILVHRGDSTKSMQVELEVLTNLGSSWLVELDSPAGYELNSGGTILNPTVTLTAPDDLTGMPKKIEIRAVAEADVEGVISVVHQDVLTLNVEKIDVYQPPVVSIWSEDHTTPIANSSRGDAIDSTIPRFAEYNEFNPFILEIFNTGFDADYFRIDILQRSKSLFQLHNNQTGQRILENEGDFTFHTSLMERHATQVFILGVKPSLDRSDPDIGEIEIEVISGGNSSSSTTVSFTIQRTFGIRAEVSQDCDGTPLGHMKVSLCAPNQERPTIDFRARITNSVSDAEAASWWLIQNPSSLKENTDNNEAYGQWEYRITDSDDESVPRVSLGPGDFTEVFVSVTMTNQVEVGNHTVFLRIVEDVEEDEPRYFDLPMTFEVEADDPTLEIVQVSQNTRLIPGRDYSIQMKVKNEGNSPLTVLLEADVDQSGWEVSIGGLSGSPLIQIEAFEETGFTVEISVPDSANNGDSIPISVSATPLDTEQGFPDSFTAKFTLNAEVEIGSILDILVNEATHPRPITLVLLVVTVLLLFAGVQSRMNRRRWAAQMEMIEALSDESSDHISVEPDIPAPVTSASSLSEVPRYEDDDVELV